MVRFLAVLLVLPVLAVGSVQAQSVQAYRARLAEERRAKLAEEKRAAESVRELTEYLKTAVEIRDAAWVAFQPAPDKEEGTAVEAWRDSQNALEAVVSTATDFILAQDPADRAARWARFLDAVQDLNALTVESSDPSFLEARAMTRDLLREKSLTRFSHVSPTVFDKYEKVSFVVGLGIGAGKLQSGFAIGTNLPGATVAGLLGGLGVGTALSDYFENNVATGLSFPTSASHDPSLSLSFGLGELRVRGHAFWPILGVDQIDADDGYLPSQLRSENEEEDTWSSPVIGLGTDTKIAGQIFLFSAGVVLPFYYPGSAIDALGALFTFSDELGDFERKGDGAVFLGISVPLFSPG